MDRFLRWVSDNNEQDPILKAGIAHVWFIMSHPFDDGNGRVGRAVTDFLLAAHYPALMGIVSLSKQISIDRKGYYRILETTGRDGLDITDWLKWFLKTLEAAMRDSQWLVERVVMKAHFWQQHKNTILNTRQQKVINRLFRCRSCRLPILPVFGDRLQNRIDRQRYDLSV